MPIKKIFLKKNFFIVRISFLAPDFSSTYKCSRHIYMVLREEPLRTSQNRICRPRKITKDGIEKKKTKI